MEYLNIVLSVLTLICGGGWFINWRAARRKSDGEATVAEADGWKAQQDVYQQTIADMEKFNDMYRKYNTTLIEENGELHKKYTEVMEKLDGQQREISRLGRRLDAALPLLCASVGCKSRVRVSITDEDDMKNEREAGA